MLFAFSEAKGDAEEPSFGDTIIVGSIADARTLVPILASDSSSAEICGLLFNGLVKYDKDLNIVSDLAESWQISDGGLTILFYLRKDVLWHDGASFSAYDVEFTYKSLIDPNVKTPYSADFERIKKLEVLNDYTVKVTYKEPFAPALSSWGMSILPRHLLEGKDFNKTSFKRDPIGTGPYIFKKWKTGSTIELESNKTYFEGRPYIDRYIYRIIPDQATMFLELSTQGLDLIGLTPLQYKRQTNNKFFNKFYRKFRYPSFGYTYLAFNLNNIKFSDKRVRQAINYAIDKDEIIHMVLLGLGRVCTGPFVPESWAYNKDVKPVPFDKTKAKELLKEAGWFDTNNDGILDKGGVPLEFTVITNQGNDARKMTLEVIQRRLAEIGIRVKIKIIEWSAFINEFIDKKNFEAVLLGWNLSRDPDCFDIWHSSKVKEGEFNFISYRNEEIDKLVTQARRIFDVTLRQKMYHRIHEILYDEQPYIFLYIPDSLPIVHSRFRGIEAAPAGIAYNFIKWYVPKSLQRYTR